MMAPVTLPPAFVNRVSRDLGVEIPIVQAPMGWIARSQLASAVSQGRGVRDHRDLVGRARRGEGRDPPDARPHRQAVRRQHRPGVRPRSEHRRVRDRPGRQVRDHVGRLADEVHEHPQAGRAHRVPRRADAGRGAQGRRRRRRRARRRGRRGRRVQEPDAGGDDGPAAARALPGGRPDHRRRRHRRRRHDGRRLRPRRRGRADGHPHGVGARVAGPRQLEAGDRRRPPRPTPCS